MPKKLSCFLGCYLILSAACVNNSTFGQLDMAGSSIILSSPTIFADGQDDTKIVVSIKRQNGTALSGLSVVINAAGCNVLQTNTITNAAGQVFASLTSTQPGIRYVDAVVSIGSNAFVLPVTSPVVLLPVISPSTATAGVATDFTVVAQNSAGLADPNYSNTVSFVSSDPCATLPMPYTFSHADGGRKIFSNAIIFYTAGVQFVEAIDSRTNLIISKQTYNVKPAAEAFFVIDNATASIQAGEAFSWQLHVVDAFDNTIINYAQEVQFSSNDPNAVLPAAYTFSAADMGVHVFANLVLKTAGSCTISVADPFISTQKNIVVVPGASQVAYVSFLNNITSVNVNTLLDIAVSIQDLYGNITPDFTGEVGFFSSDNYAILPSNRIFSQSNMGEQNILQSTAFKTAGIQDISAYVVDAAAIMSQPGNIMVQNGNFAYFLVDCNTTAVAGSYVDVVATAKDIYGNTVSSYTGSIQVSTTNPNSATVPSIKILTASNAGVYTYTLVFYQAGLQTISVVDATSGITGNTNILITPAAAAYFYISDFPNALAAGSLANSNLQITAMDNFNNIQADYQGTVAFDSSDSNALLPSNYTFVANNNGVALFHGVTLRTAGNQNIVVKDTQHPSIIGIKNNIVVTAGNAYALNFLTNPTEQQNVCSPLLPAITVQLQDMYGNQTINNSNTSIALYQAGTGYLLGVNTLSQYETSQIVFDDLSINASGLYRLQARSDNSNIIAAIGTDFNVVSALPVVQSVVVADSNSCMGFAYEVTSACPFDLSVRYATDGNFLPATQAAKHAASLGTRHIPGSMAAVSGTFVWDSTRDLPRRSSNAVTVAFTATAAGQESNTFLLQNITVDHALQFAPGVDYQTIDTSRCLVAADINHDGWQDVVTCSTNNAILQYWQNTADGTGRFNAAKSIAMLQPVVSIAVGDINHDGKQDIAVAGTSLFAWYAGSNNGNFVLSSNMALSANTVDMGLVDINRDGFIDAWFAQGAPYNTLMWSLQNSNGTFAAMQSVAASGNLYKCATADINRDGLPDAVCAIGGGIQTFLGNGSGFSAGTLFSTSYAISFIAIGDINHDGMVDIAAMSVTNSTLLLFLGDGSGAFTLDHVLNITTQAAEIVLQDMDADGFIDAVISYLSTASVSVVLGPLDTNVITSIDTATSLPTMHLVLADFTHDGQMDIVATTNGHFFTTLANQRAKSCSWSLAAPRASYSNLSISAGAIGDFNEDGRDDVAVISAAADIVAIYTNNGVGGFKQSGVATTGAAPQDIAVADINADTHLDVVIANANDNTLSVILGDGNGYFATVNTISLPYMPYTVVLGDINTDGIVDAVVGYAGGVAALLGIGNGQLKMAYNLWLDANITSLALADINHDGALDVAIANNQNQAVVLLLGNNTGQFVNSNNIQTNCLINRLALGMINPNNTDLDMVVGCSNGNILTWLGNGTGAFAADSTLVSTGTGLIALGDVTGDGIGDIVSDGGSYLNLFINNANNTWSPIKITSQLSVVDIMYAYVHNNTSRDIVTLHALGKTNYIVASLNDGYGHFAVIANNTIAADYDIHVADFNQDGNFDIAALSVRNSNVSIALGDGAGGFIGYAAAYAANTSAGYRIAIGDINRDGWLDFAVGACYTADTRIYVNTQSNGIFNDAATYAISVDDIHLVDINRDGILDIVGAPATSASVAAYLGSSDASFSTTPINFLATSSMAYAALADVDTNGYLDIISPAPQRNAMGVKRATDGGPLYNNTLSPDFSINQTTGSGIAADDFNHDGIIDIIFSANGNNIPFLYIAFGLGDGTFDTNIAAYQLASNPSFIVTGDINADGAIDIILTMQNDASIAVMLGDGTGSFGAANYYIASGLPIGVALGDMNKDGLLDVISADAASGNLPSHVMVRLSQ